ncbi:MAG: hypothetical protein WDO15_26550 [Bacteroidota bacterium]
MFPCWYQGSDSALALSALMEYLYVWVVLSPVSVYDVPLVATDAIGTNSELLSAL